MGTGFGCRLEGMETMFVSYTIVLRGFLYFCCTVLAVSATGVVCLQPEDDLKKKGRNM